MVASHSKNLKPSTENPLGRRDFMKIVGSGIVVFFAADPWIRPSGTPM